MYINIKSNKLSTHKNQCNLKYQNEKKLKLIVGLMCLKMYNPFLITDRPFSRPAEWSSPRLERFAAQQAWQSDLLGKSQKNWAVAVDPAVDVDLAVSLSMYSTLPMEVGRWPHWPRRAESTKAVDDGEA